MAAVALSAELSHEGGRKVRPQPRTDAVVDRGYNEEELVVSTLPII